MNTITCSSNSKKFILRMLKGSALLVLAALLAFPVEARPKMKKTSMVGNCTDLFLSELALINIYGVDYRICSSSCKGAYTQCPHACIHAFTQSARDSVKRCLRFEIFFRRMQGYETGREICANC